MNGRGEYGRLLGSNGPLARVIEGFESRREQQLMADWVGETLATRGTLAIEAGTGTGKDLRLPRACAACPAGRSSSRPARARSRTSSSTVTCRPLRRRSAVRLASRLLKGRANYLCLHRLDLAESAPQLPGIPQPNERMLGRIRRWSRTTATGDLSEVKSLRDSDPARMAVTSTRENCLGASCPAYSRCHVVAARRDAQAADIVVVNHHLLLADLALKDEGFGELLPGTEAVILDEAHQVPEIAAQFFGREFSARQAALFARDALAELTRLGLALRRPGSGLRRSSRRSSRPLPRSPAASERTDWPSCRMPSWAPSTAFARP